MRLDVLSGLIWVQIVCKDTKAVLKFYVSLPVDDLNLSMGVFFFKQINSP